MSDYTEDWHGWEAREEAESRTRGEAMSTALEACHQWQHENRDLMWTLEGRDRDEALFLAGYRRALEDAAEHINESSEVNGQMLALRRWLRDRAAGVGTKDEPLFACCGEWHSGPPCPCRCGHAYEQHTDSIGCVNCKGGSCVKYVGTKDGDDDE